MKICYIRPVGPTLMERAFVEVYKSKNTKAIKLFVIVATILANVNTLLAEEPDNPIKQLGNEAISMIQLCVTIIAIIMALFETGKAMMEGDPKKIPSIAAKYGIGVILTYAIPWGFFKIKDAFAEWEMK